MIGEVKLGVLFEDASVILVSREWWVVSGEWLIRRVFGER